MKLPASVATAIDYTATVEAELRAHNRFLPPSWGDMALRNRPTEVSSWLRSALRRDLRPETDDTVMMRKSGGGARPLSYMTLLDRLAYRAAVSGIGDVVDLGSRTDESYSAFIRAPLSVDECRYILKTDISAFYHYIDHERLIDEVVTQTGEDLAISFAVEVLRVARGRRFGLPQMTEPSDILGEIYIAPMHTALLRGGFNTVRFADDFRVACGTYNEALEAREFAERSALHLGLTLSETKTTIPRINTYAQSLTEVEVAESELFGALAGDSFDVDSGYNEGESTDDASPWSLGKDGAGFADDEVDSRDDEATPDQSPQEVQVEAARLAVDIWLGDGEDGPIGSQWTSHVRATLLRKALKILEQARDPWALKYATAMLVTEPHLTPQVCNYMRALMESDRRAVMTAINRTTRRRIVGTWQSIWISYCAGDFSPRRGGENHDHVKWLNGQMQSEHGALAAEATLALARRDLVKREDVIAVLARVPAVHRSPVVMALGLLGGTATAAGAGDTQLERWQAEWAARHWGR